MFSKLLCAWQVLDFCETRPTSYERPSQLWSITFTIQPIGYMYPDEMLIMVSKDDNLLIIVSTSPVDQLLHISQDSRQFMACF